MTIANQLRNCKDMQDLGRLFHHLETVEKGTLDGRNIRCQNKEVISLDAVKKKIVEVYNLELKRHPENPELVYKNTNAAIFQLEKMTVGLNPSTELFKKIFGQQDDVGQLNRHCVQSILQNAHDKETMINNYNELAQKCNESIANKSESNITQELQMLAHLNRFLGVSWTSANYLGKERIPLYTTSLKQTDLPLPPPGEDLEKCENLAHLTSFLVDLINKHSSLQLYPDYILTQNGKKIRFEDIQDRLLGFISAETVTPTLHFFEIAISAINLLAYLKPVQPNSYPTQKEELIDGLKKRIIAEMRTNPKLMEESKDVYQQLALQINEYILDSMVQGFSISLPHLFNAILSIGTYAELLDIPMTAAQVKGIAFFPLEFNLDKESSLLSAMDSYGFSSLLFNYLKDIDNKRERIAEIEQMIRENPYTHVGMYMDDEKRSNLKLELARLKTELSHEEEVKKVPKQTLQSLLNLSVKLAADLTIKLSEDQKAGKAPLPILGREFIDFAPSQKGNMSETGAWLISGKLRLLNRHIRFTRLQKELDELNEIPLMELFKDELKTQRRNEVHEELESLRGKVVGPINFLSQLNHLLYFNGIFQFAQLDEEQKLGLKEWPNTFELQDQ